MHLSRVADRGGGRPSGKVGSHAKYRWTAPDFSDYGEGFDLAQRWLCQQHNVPAPDWRSMLQIKGIWQGGIRSPDPQPSRCFDPDLLPLAPATRPATGRRPRPLRPLRDYAVGLRLALPAPAAVRPRPRRDLDSRRRALRRRQRSAPRRVSGRCGELPERHRGHLAAPDPTLRGDETSTNVEQRTISGAPPQPQRTSSQSEAVPLRDVPRSVGARRAPPIPWSPGRYEPAVGHYVKYEKEFRAASAYATIIRSRADWENGAWMQFDPASAASRPVSLPRRLRYACERVYYERVARPENAPAEEEVHVESHRKASFGQAFINDAGTIRSASSRGTRQC